MNRLLFTLALIGASFPAFGQDDYQAEYDAALFRGWTGILFSCESHSGNEDFIKRLCDRITQEFDFLAEFSGITSAVVSGKTPLEQFRSRIELGEPVDVKVQVQTTQVEFGTVAVSVAIEVSRYASGWADRSAVEGPTSMARPGTLVLWRTSMVGSGNIQANDLLTALSDNITGHLQTVLVKHSRAQTWEPAQQTGDAQ